MALPVSLPEAQARLRRVRDHIEELRRSGRDDDAEAVQFVRELAERALAVDNTPHPRDLLTTGQTALSLGLSDQTVRNWVAAGRLPAVQRGVRTMIPRKAVEAEIERSRLRPSRQPTREDEATRVAWRRQLLAALPEDVAARLEVLHDKLEDGQQLSVEEQAQMVQLERQMSDAAAHALGGSSRGRSNRAP